MIDFGFPIGLESKIACLLELQFYKLEQSLVVLVLEADSLAQVDNFVAADNFVVADNFELGLVEVGSFELELVDKIASLRMTSYLSLDGCMNNHCHFPNYKNLTSLIHLPIQIHRLHLQSNELFCESHPSLLG